VIDPLEKTDQLADLFLPSRHPAGTTSRSNAIFEFSVPAGTMFAVPAEQVVAGMYVMHSDILDACD